MKVSGGLDQGTSIHQGGKSNFGFGPQIPVPTVKELEVDLSPLASWKGGLEVKKL